MSSKINVATVAATLQSVAGVELLVQGTGDGCLTAAAFGYLAGGPERFGTNLSSPRDLDRVAIDQWRPNSAVVICNMPVADQRPEMAAEFLRAVYGAGHKVVAIADHHPRMMRGKVVDANPWRTAFKEAGLEAEFESLLVKPDSAYGSAGRLLLEAMDGLEGWLNDLFIAAEACDERTFLSFPLARKIRATFTTLHLREDGVDERDEGDRRRYAVIEWLSGQNPNHPMIKVWEEGYEPVLEASRKLLESPTVEAEGFQTFPVGKTHVDLRFMTAELDADPNVRVYGFYQPGRRGDNLLLLGAREGTDLVGMLDKVGIRMISAGIRHLPTVTEADAPAAIAAVKEWLAQA